VNDEVFALLVERYAAGDLDLTERRSLTEAVLADPARKAQFARQVRLSLELGALLQEEDAEDARLRASLIVSEDADARDRRVMDSLEKRLRIGAWKAEAERERRRSTRSMSIVREVPAPSPVRTIAALAAGVVLAIVGLLWYVNSGDSREQVRGAGARAERPVDVLARPHVAPAAPPAPDFEAERAKAAAKMRAERMQRLAKDREEMDRAEREDGKTPGADTSAPAPPRRSTTAVAMARLVATTGSVYVLAQGKRTPAQAGQDVLSGQGIETVGPLSWAAVRYGDGTRLELWADTRVARLTEPVDPADPTGKQAFVTEGTMIGAFAKQPKDRPFVLRTPQGEAQVLGTVLALTVEPDGIGQTRLEVGEGKVRFIESVNQKSIDVSTGLYTVAAAGNDMKLKSIPPLVDTRRRPAPANAGLDPARVAAAVKRGAEFLKTAASPAMNGSPDSDELILWTFIQAGVDPYDKKFQELLMKILDDRRENATYSVAVRAILLEQLNRIAYQGQLLRCAQVLVDNQCQNGQWDYRVVVPVPDDPVELIPADPGRSSGKGIVQRFAVRKRRDGPPTGDNSNSYYAALGLRACHDAGIVVPEDVISRARGWWVKSQFPDELNSAPIGPVRGWGYGTWRSTNARAAYGSMTAAGVASVAIYDFMEGTDWKKDPAVKAGLSWIAQRFSASDNALCTAEETGRMLNHYLCAVERAGILCGTEAFGRHAWYPEAAKLLLDAQKGDGSWNAGWDTTWDTCFAILFLRRAGYSLEK
jgi:hypothetical protein